VWAGIVPTTGPFSKRHDGILNDRLYPPTKEFLNLPFENFAIEL